MDKDAFERAKLKVLLKQNDPHGFGTLQEKTVHAVMKLAFEPDEDFMRCRWKAILRISTGKDVS